MKCAAAWRGYACRYNCLGFFSSYTCMNNMQPEMGKTKKRGYICYPGLMYTYGLPYPPKTESVALGMYVRMYTHYTVCFGFE